LLYLGLPEEPKPCLTFRSSAVVLILLTAPTAVMAQTDEIQVYNAEIAELGL